jgi:hypothetical protein
MEQIYLNFLTVPDIGRRGEVIGGTFFKSAKIKDEAT